MTAPCVSIFVEVKTRARDLNALFPFDTNYPKP